MTNGTGTGAGATRERARWRRSSDAEERSDSHLPIHEIKRRLHISRLASGVLWLSKTDYFVLSLCPTTTRSTLTSLGMMVIFTTALAFCSALYTVKTAIVPPGAYLAWPISVALACVYAFGILIIDRELVGATSNKALWIRAIFAALIATAVSYPVKLLFFEGRIVNEIGQMLEEEHAPKLQRIHELKSTVETERRQQRGEIRAQIEKVDSNIAVIDGEVAREKDIVRCGPKCQALLAQKEEMMAMRLGLVEKLDSLDAPGHLPEPIRREIDRLQAEMDARSAVAYDFLYKAEALDRIAREVGPSYQYLSWFVFAFFFLLEIVPVSLKLSLGKTEYHYYIDARTQINNQKIVSIANLYIARMQETDQEALDVPMEVTDIIAASMEDESTATRRLGSRSVSDVIEATGDAGPDAGFDAREARADPFDGVTPPDGPTPGAGDRRA